MADAPVEPSRRRDIVGEHLLTAYLITTSLGRALFFTGLGIVLFVVAFLGYFTISFLFLAVAVFLLASGTATRKYQRMRGRSTRR